MKSKKLTAALLSLPAILFASCSQAQTGDSAPAASSPATAVGPFSVTEHGSFAEPWALAVEPGTGTIFITEKAGTMKFYNPASGKTGTVEGGVPEVSYGGQGGLGDVAFAPDYATSGTIYLTWAQDAGEGSRYAAMGSGKLVCAEADTCRIDGFRQIWRQEPAIRSAGHFSHKIAFSPDGQYLYLSSGERMQGEPAQKLDNNLGKVLRLMPDGSPAPGNPFADMGSPSDQIWSYGHRNLLGLKFDPSGQLYDLEHGPRGGDEINKVVEGANYGWPTRSNGINYNGDPIPDHTPDDGFTKPVIYWTPVIAPGDFIFYSGKLWPEWAGDAIIAGLATEAIARVEFSSPDSATEVDRTEMGARIRDIMEYEDGAIWVIEDGDGGRLLRLAPAS